MTISTAYDDHRIPYVTTEAEVSATDPRQLGLMLRQMADRHFHPHHRAHQFLKAFTNEYVEKELAHAEEVDKLKAKLAAAEELARLDNSQKTIPPTSGTVLNLTVNLPEGAGESSRTIIVHPAENKSDVAITFEPSEQLRHNTATATLPVKPTKETAPAVALKVLEDAGYSIESDYSLGEAVRALKDHALAESVKSKSVQTITTTKFGPFERHADGSWIDTRLSAELYNR